MNNYYALYDVVLDKSFSEDWDSAVKEWEIVGTRDNQRPERRCICGHNNIRYEFTIKNRINGNILYPIGSTCIQKFRDPSLNNEVNNWVKAIKLLQALEKKDGANELKSLNPNLFSKELFFFLYEKGAFPANKYNGNNGANDRDFMVKMLLQRAAPTEKQEKKIYMILSNSIHSWLCCLQTETGYVNR